MRIAATLTLALALAYAPGAARQNDEVTLRWILKAGDVFYAKGTANVDQTIEVMGQTIDMQQEINTVMRYKVKSVSAGKTTVEMTYVEMKTKITGLPGGLGGGDPTEKLKGATVTATLNENLEVVKVEGYSELLDKLADGDETQRKLFEAVIPEAGVKQLFSQTFVAGPNKPVKVGDTWAQNDKLPLGGLGEVTTKQKFELKSIKDGLATVSVKADLVFKPGTGGGLPFKITKADLTAEKFSGTHVFDIKAGRLKESKTEMVMSGSMTIGVAGQEIDAALKQKMKSVSVVTDKNPVKD